MFTKYGYILITVLVILLTSLWPSFFLLHGTYFLLDTTFAPFTEFRGFFEGSYYWILMDFGNYVFGYTLWSKIFFLSVVGAGVYAGLLLSRYISLLFANNAGKYLDIISIIVLIYNPFIYERMISQTGIALGIYCIIIATLLLLIQKQVPEKSCKYFLGSSLFYGIGWMIFPHAVLLILLVLGCFSVVYYKNILKYIAVCIGVILLNANWLIGDFYLQSNQQVSKLETFDRTNIEVFQGNSLSGLGVDVTQLLGYGFWGERYHIVSPDDIISFWYIFAFIVLGVVLYGGYILYKKQKKTLIILGIIGVVSYILSLGITSPIWGNFNNVLYEHVPFYIGMREPQKWLGLTQMVYMILLVIGVMSIYQKCKTKYLIGILLCLLPVLWTPTNLVGYWGQLNISDYPDDVFVARDFMKNNIPQNTKILNFPWHSYMACDWTYNKVTVNRSKDLFYPANIIVSDNIEIAHLYTNSNNLLSQDIESYLKNKDVSLLQKNDISYILFSKTCADRGNYSFLDEETDEFKKIFENSHINIYQITYEK